MSAANKKPEEAEDGPNAPPVELLDLTEDQISSLEPEVELEPETETPKTISFEPPDELRLVLRLFDDCSSITKPFIDAQASLKGFAVDKSGKGMQVSGCLRLQLDGFDGSRGQSLPVLEPFDLDFHLDKAETLTKLAIGAEAVQNTAHDRATIAGSLHIQLDGKGDFTPVSATLAGSDLRIRGCLLYTSPSPRDRG